jgi:ribosomal protein S18 acetylase RimI-like enzyme
MEQTFVNPQQVPYPALGPVRRTGPLDIDIRAMSGPVDVRHAHVLLARQRRWLRSMDVDVYGAMADDDSADYADPADFYAVPDGLLLIATERADDPAHERPLGLAGLRVLDDRPRTAELRRVYVDAHARGRGLGKRLLTVAIEHALWLPVDELVLEAMPSTMAAAVAMYRAAGFREVAPLGHTTLPGVVTLGLSLASGR